MKELFMIPVTSTQRPNQDIIKTGKFQHHKGFFLIDFDFIMTKHQLVTIMKKYQLVEFLNGGQIKYREVVFWHAALEDSYLKIIAYDIKNKVVIKRLHDLTKPKYSNDWFLIADEVIKDELLEFDF